MAGGQSFAGAVAVLLGIDAESGHHSIARHVEHRSAVSLGGDRQRSAKFIQQRHDARRRKALRHSRVAAQIGEQHGGLSGAHRSRSDPRHDHRARGPQPGTPRPWFRTHALRNPMRYSFTSFLWVVHMPWGAPFTTFKVAFLMILDDSRAD